MTAENQEGSPSALDLAWQNLAARTVKNILSRQGFGYAQLADALACMDVRESPRSVEGKVQRGTFQFTFMLQAALATRCVCPPAWEQAQGSGSWKARATAVIKADLGQQRWIDANELSRRLQTIGVVVPPKLLKNQIRGGTFTAALYLQCAAVCRFDGLFLFVDPGCLMRTAEEGVAKLAGY
ncbi:hypothetical protein AWB75_04142 [Caballeronia catudaia]|uniref:DUF6471 domain-containing protein n=1 Tax=Caballeronia catudaia TaxID=1777136 RepID=A0A158BWD4_9BURK|nr:DUF6471 domain-containing protein [Caballeronia catudaia]SAK74408.1 hypothetical protein AWB75_04142 [Caballeronia catudaia]